MGTRSNRRSASRRKTVAFVVGFFLTLAFGLGQSATVFAAGAGGGSSVGASGGGSTRPDPTSAKATDSKSGSTVGTSANAAPSGGLAGGDVSLDYVAAGPGTYNHDTGVGGAYANRTIDKNTGVVESLEGGDFACGDLVVFFTQVVIDAGASGSGAVQLDYQWNGNTTGQPGIGFVDLVSASSNSPDSGNTANGNESVSILSESDTPNVNASIQITNLDPGEHFILRTVVRLGCQVGAHPTGNILTAIKDASVVGDGRISVGNQTVPLKKVEDIAQPGISVQKTCPQSGSIGDAITYSITVTNTGNEELTNLVVNDPLLGGNLGKFPSSLAAGASDTETFTHTVTANDPDPLTNSVTATAVGATSGATVSDQDSCDTDILHQPGISVQKTCPAGGHVGDTITYSITVTNTGNERLDDLVVTDALLGGTLSSFPTSLAVGGSSTRTFTYTLTANDPDPLTNSVTASGTGADSGTQVSDTDSCQTDVLHTAGIDVSKTCPEGGNIGDTITYSITVTNTGDEALTDVVVNDPLLGGDLAGFPSTLAVGASVTKTFTHTITADDPDPLTNTVTASGTGADSQASVQDTDSCGTDVHHQPGISVQKTCPEAASIGDTITYSITVTNTGNERLDDLQVVDQLLGGTLAGFPSTLAVGDSVTKTFTHTITADDPDPLTNTVTASGTGADSGETVSDQADCTTDISHTAGIDVSKTCPEGGNIGDTITYSITVTNTGDEALTDVVVNDPLLGGDLAGFPSTLAVGASVTKTFTHTITADDPDPLTNTVTASGTGADSQVSVQDTDSCGTDVHHQPGISVQKTCPEAASIGDTITYSITVTNTGNEALTGVVVVDELLGGALGSFPDSLAVGDSATRTFTHTVTADDPDPLTNTVTASGTGADSDQTVSDQAECSTDVVHPTIDLVKDGPALAHVGDTITYTFTVTNPGDVDLFDVTLSDPICDPGTLHFVGGDTQGAVRLGAVGGDGILSPGEVWTYECTHVVTAEDPDPLPNTATVTAIDSQENQVSDQASHVVDIIHPAIKIVKTANPTSGSPGDTITYTYDVTNTGDTTLFDVSVDDDVMGHIGDIAELAVGETVTLTAEFTLGNSPVTNVGTATGHDVLGLEVTDDDDATVAVVAPVIEKNPKTPRPTAFTGFDDRGLTGIAIALMLLGLAAALIGRRRRGLET